MYLIFVQDWIIGEFEISECVCEPVEMVEATWYTESFDLS